MMQQAEGFVATPITSKYSLQSFAPPGMNRSWRWAFSLRGMDDCELHTLKKPAFIGGYEKGAFVASQQTNFIEIL